MMRSAAVIAKLDADLVPATLRSVGGAGDYAGIDQVLKFSRTAFVLPRADSVADNTAGSLVVRQRVLRRVRVLLGFTRQRMRTFAAELDAVEEVSEAVKASLFGWLPDGETSPVTFAGAGIVQADFDQGFLIWGCDFACPYYMRTTSDET